MSPKVSCLLLFATMAVAAVAAAEDAPARPKPRGSSKEYRAALATIEALSRAKKAPSRATGTYFDGGLENAAELPVKGSGYKLVSTTRPTRYGTDEMVFGLIELAALLQERRPGSPGLSIGDISGPTGGKLAPHINHQDGQDLDLAFFYRGGAGQPMHVGWLKCDAEGKTKRPGVTFDVERNFELLVLWLESPWFGGCDWILIYDPLKKLLVEHGRALEKKMPKHAETIRKHTDELERLMRQPESSPHDDHFHIRLARKGEAEPPAEETGGGG
jgi:penicillin-insensitive murein DD-endopeptidase